MSDEPADRLRVARVVARTAAEGPGERTAVWVQGCSIRCPGCFNPHLWTPAAGTAFDAKDVARAVFEAGTQGVTFLGGEPFEQAEGLAEVARLVRSRGLSVMTFTGHVLEDLPALGRAARALLAATDLLVDGPYDAARPDIQRPWVGSTNQRFHALTDRYRELVATIEQLTDSIEVTVRPDGTALINGWADVESLERLLEGLGPRPPGLRSRRPGR